MNDDIEVIVRTIVSYTELLNQVNTEKAAYWTVDFIANCKDWCIYIETELASMDEEICEVIRKSAQQNSEIEIPNLSQLLDATHHLFYKLLQSVYLQNEVYLFIMTNYRFLTFSQADILTNVSIT